MKNLTIENEVIIRDYKKDDWAAIERIHDCARKVELEHAGLEAAFLPLKIAAERENLMDYEGLFVAECDQMVAGFLACTEEELAWLYVGPEFMRRGIGRKLSRHALSAFPDIRYVEVLKGNEPAKNLYESLGFRVVGIEKGAMPGNEKFAVEVYSMERKNAACEAKG